MPKAKKKQKITTALPDVDVTRGTLRIGGVVSWAIDGFHEKIDVDYGWDYKASGPTPCTVTIETHSRTLVVMLDPGKSLNIASAMDVYYAYYTITIPQ